MKTKTYISDYHCITPIGFSTDANWQNILNDVSGIQHHKIFENQPDFLASKIDDVQLEREFQTLVGNTITTRLEKMLILSLLPLVEKNPISEQSILILSTTKGNVTALKNAEQPPKTSYLAELAKTIAEHFGFKTKPIVVSNACVSGVMAISLAKNLLESGMYQDAYVIAGDEVSEFVISGFNSFQALSSKHCKPYDESRDGISIGEAAAAAYVSKNPKLGKINFELLGESAINDANHISGPSRTGEGLFRSIVNAMKEARINASDIDYLSAHGTATQYNDEMESIAFTRAGLQQTPINSLKGFYGHTLGAAGLLEIVIAMKCAEENTLIASKNFEKNGVSEPINIIQKNKEQEIKTILKTASGFGGCNAALILKKTEL